MAKLSGSRRELKKIKKIKARASKKFSYSSSDISISDSYSSLSSYIEWEKIRQTTELKELNKLDLVVTNNIKNKYQRDYAI